MSHKCRQCTRMDQDARKGRDVFDVYVGREGDEISCTQLHSSPSTPKKKKTKERERQRQRQGHGIDVIKLRVESGQEDKQVFNCCGQARGVVCAHRLWAASSIL